MKTQSGRDIARHSKIGVLVYGAGDQTGQLFVVENMGERGGERGGRLHCGETDFTDDVTVGEAENTFDLIVSDAFLDAYHVAVEFRTLPAKNETNASCLLVQNKNTHPI